MAVIGGGWSGLQCVARLQQLGVVCHGFEQRDDFGGTWHPRASYPGLALHTAAWLASFASFSPFNRLSRPSATAVHSYCRRFAEVHGLPALYELSTKVVAVDYCEKTGGVSAPRLHSTAPSERTAGVSALHTLRLRTTRPHPPPPSHRPRPHTRRDGHTHRTGAERQAFGAWPLHDGGVRLPHDETTLSPWVDDPDTNWFGGREWHASQVGAAVALNPPTRSPASPPPGQS